MSVLSSVYTEDGPRDGGGAGAQGTARAPREARRHRPRDTVGGPAPQTRDRTTKAQRSPPDLGFPSSPAHSLSAVCPSSLCGLRKQSRGLSPVRKCPHRSRGVDTAVRGAPGGLSGRVGAGTGSGEAGGTLRERQSRTLRARPTSGRGAMGLSLLTQLEALRSCPSCAPTHVPAPQAWAASSQRGARRCLRAASRGVPHLSGAGQAERAQGTAVSCPLRCVLLWEKSLSHQPSSDKIRGRRGAASPRSTHA